MAKTYAQFLSQIDALRAKADAVRRKEAAGQIKRVRDLIALYGLTAEDLGLVASATQGAGSAGSPAVRGRDNARKPTANAAKYQDGAGHSWTGRGPKPGWLKAALSEGKSLDDFRAEPQSPAASSARSADAPAPKPSGRKSSARKNAPKAQTTAKFRLGEQSWSGRGPQPRWLKEALDGGKSLDDLRVG